MQSHVFFRKYIKGIDNWATDFMSRMYESHKANVVNTELSNIMLLWGDDITEAFRICHKGMRKTYKVLCAKYPGHLIPQRLVAE